MPTFEVVTGALDDEGRRRVARRIGAATAQVGQPIDLLTVIFVEPASVFVHGGEAMPAQAFARVNVTIGGLTEGQRRQLARTVCDLLCDEGVREDGMTRAPQQSRR